MAKKKNAQQRDLESVPQHGPATVDGGKSNSKHSQQRSRHATPPVHIVIDDSSLAPNISHPMAGFSLQQRQLQRLHVMADILAEMAKRKAAELSMQQNGETK